MHCEVFKVTYVVSYDQWSTQEYVQTTDKLSFVAWSATIFPLKAFFAIIEDTFFYYKNWSFYRSAKSGLYKLNMNHDRKVIGKVGASLNVSHLKWFRLFLLEFPAAYLFIQNNVSICIERTSGVQIKTIKRTPMKPINKRYNILWCELL